MTRLSEAEWAQALAEDDDDRRFRRNAWRVLWCFTGALWIALAGVVVVLNG